jgi:hypothetical protein
MYSGLSSLQIVEQKAVCGRQKAEGIGSRRNPEGSRRNAEGRSNREFRFHRELRFPQLKPGAAHIAASIERQQQEVFGSNRA